MAGQSSARSFYSSLLFPNYSDAFLSNLFILIQKENKPIFLKFRFNPLLGTFCIKNRKVYKSLSTYRAIYPWRAYTPLGGKKMAKTKRQDKTQKRTCGTTEVPLEIFEHWIHSHEEDTEDVKVYRPHDYVFPPTRGRTGFEIKENGEFIQYDIAPACGVEKVMGRWKAEGKKRSRPTLKFVKENPIH
jgi:hypothetical protein